MGSVRVVANAVASISRTENYVQDTFGVYTLTALFKPSDVVNVILPAANKLEGTLIMKDFSGKIQSTTKYRLVLSSNTDVKLANNSDHSSDIRELDKHSMVTLSFQFIDHATFDLRLAQTGAISHDTPAIELLKLLLSKHLLKDTYSNKDSVASFSVTSGWDPVKKLLIVKDGTYISGLAKYLQETYGVYAQGCACFLKDRVWYIYPPYGVATAGEKAKLNQLVVINVPGNRYGHNQVNYRVEGQVTTILAAGNTEHINTSDVDALNHGTGVMYAKSKTILGGTTHDISGMVAKPEKYMVEYDTSEYKGKERHIVVPDQAFISNEAHITTALAARAGDVVQVIWQHGDITKIKPDSAVTFITQDENGIRTLYGTILAAESHSSIPERGIVEKMHQENVKLTLFLKRVKK